KRRTAIIQEKAKEAGPYRKELAFFESKIEELEALEESLNTALTQASNSGDNSAMMEHSKALGETQKEIEVLFEQLEAVSEIMDEINAKYDLKLAELD
ncbi:MAG: ABC transporter ATP-binding protein, partial [Campylobacterota bacterium]|nr:ABC transporter ATP-binding protein [Campylobacterota bacterium]